MYLDNRFKESRNTHWKIFIFKTIFFLQIMLSFVLFSVFTPVLLVLGISFALEHICEERSLHQLLVDLVISIKVTSVFSREIETTRKS